VCTRTWRTWTPTVRVLAVPPMSAQYPLLYSLHSAPAAPCERACTRPARPRRCRALAFGVQTCRAGKQTNTHTHTHTHAQPSVPATRSLGSANNSSAAPRNRRAAPTNRTAAAVGWARLDELLHGRRGVVLVLLHAAGVDDVPAAEGTGLTECAAPFH
jgi:hypothetical protein